MGTYLSPTGIYAPTVGERGWGDIVNIYNWQYLNTAITDLYATKISLQSSFPGTAQTGHGHITGTFKADDDLQAGDDISAGDAITAVGNINSTTASISAFTSLSAGTTVTAGTNIVATAGYIRSLTSYVQAGTYLQAGSFVQAQTDIYSNAGNIYTVAGDINSGNEITSVGNISSGGWMYATTFLESGSYAYIGAHLQVADYGWIEGNLGVGVTGSGSPARLYVLDTATPQFRIAYNTTYYVNHSVDISGNYIIDAVKNSITLRAGTADGSYSGGIVYPYSTLYTDIGAYNRKWRVLYAGELNVDILVAQNVLATLGGRILVAPTSKLFGDLGEADSTIKLDSYSGTFLAGDHIFLQDLSDAGIPQYERITLGTKSSIQTDATTGRQYYNFTGSLRDVDNHTPVSPPTVTPIGTTGATSYSYYLVVTYAAGDAAPSLVTTITNGNATLNSTNKNRISWPAYDHATGYKVLRGATTGATVLLATLGSGTLTVDDTGQTRTSYTASTVRKGHKWFDGNAAVNQFGNSSTGGLIDITSTVGYVPIGAGSITINGPSITIISRTGTAYGDLKPTVNLGSLKNLVDYGSNDYHGLAIGNDLTLSPATASGFKGITADTVNGFRMFNVDLRMYNSTTLTGYMRPSDGLFAIGTNVGSIASNVFTDNAAGATFVVSPAAYTGWGLENLAAGSVLIGPNTGGNVLWDGTDLHIRQLLVQITTFLTTATSTGYYARFKRPFELDTNSAIGTFSAFGSGGTVLSPNASSSGAVGGRMYRSTASSGDSTSGTMVVDFWNSNRSARVDANGLSVTTTGSNTPIRFYDTTGSNGTFGNLLAYINNINQSSAIASGYCVHIMANNALAATNSSVEFRARGTVANTDVFLIATNTRNWVDFNSIAYFGGNGGASVPTATSGYVAHFNGNALFTVGNWINMNSGGTPAVPNYISRSTGTRIIIYDNFLSGNYADFAIGIAPNTLWFSTPIYNCAMEFYHGVSNVGYRQMRLIGDLNGNGGVSSYIAFSCNGTSTSNQVAHLFYANDHATHMGEYGYAHNGSTSYTAFYLNTRINTTQIRGYTIVPWNVGTAPYMLHCLTANGTMSTYIGSTTVLETSGGRNYFSGLGTGDAYVVGVRNGSSGSIYYNFIDTSGQYGWADSAGAYILWVAATGHIWCRTGRNLYIDAADLALYSSSVARWWDSTNAIWAGFQFVTNAPGQRLAIFTSQAGGVEVGYFNTTTGAYVAVSDENRKCEFKDFDAIEKISTMQRIKQWFWKKPNSDEPDYSLGLQVGPTAQSMRNEAGYGNDETKTDVGAAGRLALAGVQQLIDRIKQLEARIEALGG